MTSLSDIVFNEQLRVFSLFKSSLDDNFSELLTKEKRKMFINWYMEQFPNVGVEKNIKNLSKYYLFISKRQIEKLYFNYE